MARTARFFFLFSWIVWGFAVLLTVMQYRIEKCLLPYVHLMALLPLRYPDAPLVALLEKCNFTSACVSSSSGPLPVLFANSLLSVFLLLFLPFFQSLWYCILKKSSFFAVFVLNSVFICLFQKLKIKMPWFQIFILCSTLPFCKHCPCNSAEPSFKN